MTGHEPGLTWQRSSYSGNGEACVEVAWRTSTYSNGEAACVEVAPAVRAVLVRDSKDPGGPSLAVSSASWQGFLSLTRD